MPGKTFFFFNGMDESTDHQRSVPTNPSALTTSSKRWFFYAYLAFLVFDVTLLEKWSQRESQSVEASSFVSVFMESLWAMG